MTTKYLDSKRIEGTAEDRAGYPAISGGWKELARTTLGSSNSTIDVTGLADKRYYMVLYNMIDDGSNSQFITNKLGNGSFDTGNNYAERGSSNGAADFNYAGTGYWNTSGGDQVCPELTVQYLANKSDKEKLEISHSCGAQADGASTAPNRREHTGKWVNTSNVIDRIRTTTAYGSRTYGTGSEMVVLGYDPDDTHTTNFWEQLASVELSSAGDTLSSGTITAKKYLWIQIYNPAKPTGSNTYAYFNNVTTGGTHAGRSNTNGVNPSTGSAGSDYQLTSSNGSILNHDTSDPDSGTTPMFTNMFVINNASNEKLSIIHSVSGWSSTTGAGVAPARYQNVGKWANTSNAITSVQCGGLGTNGMGAGSFIKVWGSN